MEAHPLYGALSQWGLLDPIKPVYDWCNQIAKLTASTFNWLDYYASISGHGSCNAEHWLAAFFPGWPKPLPVVTDTPR